MKYETKQRVLLIGLWIMVVWPTIHHVLVRTTDISPWKFFGWAMYCVPSPIVQVNPLGLMRDPDGKIEVFSLQKVTVPVADRPRLEKTYKAFGLRRPHLGKFARPNEFAAALLAAYRSHQGRKLDGIRVVVRHYEVDRATARLVALEPDVYDYWLTREDRATEGQSN